MKPSPPIGLNWLAAVERDPSDPDLELASAFTVPVAFMASLGASPETDEGVWWRVDACDRATGPGSGGWRGSGTRICLP